jgi:hypothetical protein
MLVALGGVRLMQVLGFTACRLCTNGCGTRSGCTRRRSLMRVRLNGCLTASTAHVHYTHGAWQRRHTQT